MPRLRLGVALLLPPAAAAEVDGLRRALGDGALGRIPAHLTLVPPVNVRTADLGAALALLRAAGAAGARPFTLTIGPVVTFAPATPVLYLAAADPEDRVGAVRDAVFRGPLARPLTWPFVPHVTVADEVDADRIPTAVAALADFRLDVIFDRLHLLQEGESRVWRPVADAAFAPPIVVGRGGLPLEIAVGTLVDPEAAAHAPPDSLPAWAEPLVVVARREGAVAGVLQAWTSGDRGEVVSITVAPAAAADEIDRHLLAHARSAAADRGADLDG